MQLRTFIALEIPEEPRQRLAEQLKAWSRAYPQGINWVKPENLHLTLLFIGETPTAVVPQVTRSLALKCEDLQPYGLEILGVELYPALNPRLLWVKLKAEDSGIFSLPKTLAKALEPYGLKPDLKPLKLHITLGRIKAPQSASREREFLQTELSGGGYMYDTISFYKSSLQPDGPVYTALEQYKL